MTIDLPEAFLRQPIAHRAYHDLASGRPENSLSAIDAAISGGYGIEIDLQLSADGQALVFHDYDLDRLTGATGPIAALTAGQATAVPLTGTAHGDRIPTLAQVLARVAGRVPLLIELKDQGQASGIGPLEAATAAALDGYAGPVAVMSFNPDQVAEMARLAPQIPRGLTTCAFDPADWPLDPATCAHLRAIPDAERLGAAFISHHHTDLDRPRVRALCEAGLAVLCWTIRSPAEEAQARTIAHNITFEGYAARPPG
ncbi:MAG: phosphodiesterase [Rhodobacteraceae bacterium]|nr:phosphodiesterase [Paracoccaceae bacterium]